MADDAKQKARAELRRVQSEYDRKHEEARAARRSSFKRAQEAGLSLREIAEEVDMHWTRVGEIIRGE